MRLVDWITTVLLCIAPVSELRGGLPYAMARGADPYVAAVVAVLANLAIIPLVLVGLRFAEPLVRRSPRAAALLDVLFARTRRKGRWIERLGAAGLVLIVAVPLPGTGAWTGALLSFLFGIPARRAAPLIAVGVGIAGALVLLAGLGAIRLFGLASASG